MWPNEPVWVQGEYLHDEEYFTCNDFKCKGMIVLSPTGLAEYQTLSDNFLNQIYKNGQRGSPAMDRQDTTKKES